MFFKIKVRMLKKSSVKIAILIIAGIMGICMFHKKTYDYFTGPEDMPSSSFEYSGGKYVRYNLDDVMVMGCFLERKDTNARGNIINYYYYILGAEDIGSSTVKCIVVMADSDRMEVYNEYNRYFKNRMKGKSYDSPEPYTGTGMLVPMGTFMEKKLIENLGGYNGTGLGGKIDYEPYCIVPYNPGIFDVSVFFVSVFFIVLAFVDVIIICLGLRHRKLKKYLLEQGTLEIVENDYQYSRFFTKSVRVGDIYTYLFYGGGINLIENKRIMWIYECTPAGEPQAGARQGAGCLGIEIWDNEYNCFEIFVEDRKMINSVLDYMVSVFPHIIVGYNKMLSDLYFKDNSRFKNLAYNKFPDGSQQNGGIG